MMDYQKLYDALITIKNVCCEMQNGYGCEKCPMYSEQCAVCCVVDTRPDNWDVVKPEMKLMR